MKSLVLMNPQPPSGQDIHFGAMKVYGGFLGLGQGWNWSEDYPTGAVGICKFKEQWYWMVDTDELPSNEVIRFADQHTDMVLRHSTGNLENE